MLNNALPWLGSYLFNQNTCNKPLQNRELSFYDREQTETNRGMVRCDWIRKLLSFIVLSLMSSSLKSTFNLHEMTQCFLLHTMPTL